MMVSVDKLGDSCDALLYTYLSIFPQKWAWLPRHALPNGAHFIDQVVCKVIFIFNICIVIYDEEESFYVSTFMHQ